MNELEGHNTPSYLRMWQALSDRFPDQVPYTNSFVDRSGTRWSVGYDERGLKCWIPDFPEGPW